MIEQRIADWLEAGGIERGRGAGLAAAIEAETDTELLTRARAEMDDQERARYQRLLTDLDDLRDVLERSRERVGVDPDELQQVVAAALERAGTKLGTAAAESVGAIKTWRFDPADPAFARDLSWADAFDDLRQRRKKRREARANGAKRHRSAPSRSCRRCVRTAPTRRMWCKCISNTALCAGCCRGFCRRAFSPISSGCASSSGQARSRGSCCRRLALYAAGAARLHEDAGITSC